MSVYWRYQNARHGVIRPRCRPAHAAHNFLQDRQEVVRVKSSKLIMGCLATLGMTAGMATAQADVDRDAIAERRMANVWILIDQLEKSMQSDPEESMASEETETDSVEAAISRLVLRDILEQQAEEDDSDRVQLLTMHASKGLEFPHVYLMGLEEELLPHRNAIEAGTVEEERRLAYVGITRARRTLTLTLARQRKTYGELMDCAPSRFLDELPEADLEWEGRPDREDPEKKQARGQDAIAGLRSLLG